MPVASMVGNLHSKFGHARPLGSRVIQYVRDGRTDRWTDGQKQRLLPLSYQRGNNYRALPTIHYIHSRDVYLVLALVLELYSSTCLKYLYLYLRLEYLYLYSHLRLEYLYSHLRLEYLYLYLYLRLEHLYLYSHLRLGYLYLYLYLRPEYLYLYSYLRLGYLYLYLYLYLRSKYLLTCVHIPNMPYMNIL